MVEERLYCQLVNVSAYWGQFLKCWFAPFAILTGDLTGNQSTDAYEILSSLMSNFFATNLCKKVSQTEKMKTLKLREIDPWWQGKNVSPVVEFS